MLPDRTELQDSHAAAVRLVRQYGEDADTIATLAAAEAAAHGDVSLLALWDRVIAVIARLTAGGENPPSKPN